MPDQPSDAPLTRRQARGSVVADADAAAAGAEAPAAAGTTVPEAGATDASAGRAAAGAHRVPRTDWRLGGRTVLRWRTTLLAASLVALGVGALAAALVQALAPAWSPAATLLPLAAMLVPVVWALARSRPAGLLRFRPLDVLYGVALGGLLRLVQGWLSVAQGDSGALPSYLRVDGRLPDAWWLTDLTAPIVLAPVVEELFFRGVLLVALYTVLRRPFGAVAAGIAAVAASTGVFVLVHGLAGGPGGALGGGDAVAVGLLGLVCALLVMLTGRVWGAVLVHAVYNASFVALALAGTFWG